MRIKADDFERSLDRAFDKLKTPAHRKAIVPGGTDDDGRHTKANPRSYQKMFNKSELSNGGFENFDEYLEAIQSKKFNPLLKDMETGVGADGGYLVPDQFIAQILDSGLEREIVRPRAKVFAARHRTIKVPATTITDHGSSVSNVTEQWTAEAASLTTTQPKLRMIQLDCSKLVAYTPTSNELLEDTAIPLSQAVGQLFSEALSFFLDYRFLRGTGAGQPQGILNSPALLTVQRATASEVEFVDVVGMWEKLAPGSRQNAVWIASNDTIPQIYQMHQLEGATLITPMFPSISQAGQVSSLLGRPLIFTEKLPALGTEGDLLLADLSQYAIAIKEGSFRLEMSRDEKFSTDQTSWRMVVRVDGQGIWDTSATGIDDNTFSPFVALTDAA